MLWEGCSPTSYLQDMTVVTRTTCTKHNATIGGDRRDFHARSAFESLRSLPLTESDSVPSFGLWNKLVESVKESAKDSDKDSGKESFSRASGPA
ncbi:hypothetical protein L596_010745 [Steinernema carpocapsae]|uniref:Uncharacterized protein n=1 Tax=Steinernema carpocapsae TaxID=34508 RepID=A0A4U5PK05_STECR|nr:hypothetical protein L596_010745 [Steinernema carpocapsae]